MSDGELRAHTIRVEDDTWAETEIAAKRCGLSISEYVRRTLRDQVVKSRNDHRVAALEQQVASQADQLAELTRSFALLARQRPR